MWMPMGSLYTVAALFFAYRWLVSAEPVAARHVLHDAPGPQAVISGSKGTR
jgi:hypothetical protein